MRMAARLGTFLMKAQLLRLVMIFSYCIMKLQTDGVRNALSLLQWIFRNQKGSLKILLDTDYSKELRTLSKETVDVLDDLQSQQTILDLYYKLYKWRCYWIRNLSECYTTVVAKEMLNMLPSWTLYHKYCEKQISDHFQRDIDTMACSQTTSFVVIVGDEKRELITTAHNTYQSCANSLSSGSKIKCILDDFAIIKKMCNKNGAEMHQDSPLIPTFLINEGVALINPTLSDDEMSASTNFGRFCIHDATSNQVSDAFYMDLSKRWAPHNAVGNLDHRKFGYKNSGTSAERGTQTHAI